MACWDSAGALRDAARRLLIANRKIGTARLTGQPYRYTCPSPRLYPYQWLWDSCFHAIVLADLDPAFARDELATLLSVVQPDGFLPHVIFWEGRRGHHLWPLLLGEPGSRPHYSAQTQPPMVAVALERYYDATGDRAFVAASLPAVERYYRWLGRSRDWDGDGLLAIIQPYESGLDASPQYDAALGLDPFSPVRHVWNTLRSTLHFSSLRWRRDLVRASGGFNVKDLFFNCIYVYNVRALARLVRLTGGDAAAWERAAARSEAAILAQCDDPVRGFYTSLYGVYDRRAVPVTVANLAPLLLAGLPAERVHGLVARLENPAQFGRRYPVPSVAADEPTFDPGPSLFLWRGPTWLSTNWLVYRGLRLHGRTAAASRLAERSIALVLKSGFREYYNSETGAGYGAENFGWSTLVVDLLRRETIDDRR
ncbi:MAG TPA: hypothetical protein VFL91_22765 [Thermomicrobiales bacterium]|nr:hypothetical protein [Thermomicrobiales bacterium]